MTLPDQLRIDQGNEALWQEVGAGASGMVGSGLGQDARNTMPSGRPAPMLQDMADELFRSLAPWATRGHGMPRKRTSIRPGQGYPPSGHAAHTVALHRTGSGTRPTGTGDAGSRSSMARNWKGRSVAGGKTSDGGLARRRGDRRVSSRSATVRVPQERSLSADTSCRSRHASGNALVGSEDIDVSASQAGLRHCQAGGRPLPSRSPATTLAEAVLS